MSGPIPPSNPGHRSIDPSEREKAVPLPQKNRPQNRFLFTPPPVSVASIKKGYTRLVRLLTIVLPILAIALLSLLVLWPLLKSSAPTVDLPPEAQLNILKPRYYGQDQKNQPFSMEADKAEQSTQESNVIQLTRPRGEMLLDDGHAVAINADEGRYNQKTKLLLLQKNVLLFHDDGYEIKTSEAFFDANTIDAEGHQPVTGQGPFGSLQATGFKLTEHGNHLVLIGPARVTLNHLQ